MIKVPKPTNHHAISLINSCKNIGELKQIHARILTDNNFFPHETSFQLSKLACIYALSPNESLAYAKTIFNQQQNPPFLLYNALIRGFSSSNQPLEALSLYKTMIQSGMRPNNFTFPFVIKACIESSTNRYGILIHTHVFKCGLESDSYIQSSLIHLYANGKDLKAAEQLFDVCPERDTVSWNSMIDGYVKAGNMELARAVFDRMVCRDIISWNTMINGYAIIGNIEEATRLFDEMPERNIISWNSMMVGYVKCGNVDDALKMFREMPRRDVISWNAILACYAQSGKSNEALALFDEMEATGVKPTEATVVSLLSACGHLGALDQGLYLHSYINDHKIEINSIVSTALVDTYSKCGSISRAAEVYILLSNIYAAAKRWDDARKVRNLMKSKGVAKVPGVSVIELKGMVHRFVAGDWSHPESNHIYEKWSEISTRLKNTIGYSPDTEQVLLDIEEEEKEHALSVHSEKLAIAYGFLQLGPFEAIRIVKNLRVCRDCHDVTKLISSIYDREIVVRDRNRFHHFKDGQCSCLDFW
ncbi:hypothetical protein LguiA_000852 [Lonicera macranthoides]